MTPHELLTGLKQPPHTLLHLRVWGSPAFVLDPRLQDGHKLPKWTKRSRCGMYLGQSGDHHSSVGKILNLRTGHVSAQFHVVYDELFTTVPGAVTDTVFDKQHWDDLIQLGAHYDSSADDVVSPKKAPARQRVATSLSLIPPTSHLLRLQSQRERRPISGLKTMMMGLPTLREHLMWIRACLAKSSLLTKSRPSQLDALPERRGIPIPSMSQPATTTSRSCRIKDDRATSANNA